MRIIETEQLNTVRDHLLDLHEALMDYQIREYEKSSGKVQKRGQLYDLMTSHPQFHWLRSLSGLIVSLDEFMDKTEGLEESRDLVEYIKKLLQPDESGNEFSRRYHEAVQNFPDVLVEHGRLIQVLKEL